MEGVQKIDTTIVIVGNFQVKGTFVPSHRTLWRSKLIALEVEAYLTTAVQWSLEDIAEDDLHQASHPNLTFLRCQQKK